MVTNNPQKTLIAEAAALQARGDNAGALQVLIAGHDNYPDDARILHATGQLYSGMGDYPNAAAALQRADQLAPGSPDILIPYSKALSKTGKIEDALAVSEASLRLQPNSIPALENASEVLFEANRLPDVVKCLERLIVLNPDEKRYQADFARICQKTQQFERAFAAYLKLWEDDKATSGDYAMMGQLAFLSQRSDEAIPYLEKAVEMEPTSAPSLMYLGRCYAAQGDKKAAAKALRRSIAVNPHFLDSYFFLAEIERFEEGDPAFATLEELKRQESLTLENKGGLGFALSRMYHGIADYDKAFENLKLGNDCTKEVYASLGYPPMHEELDRFYRLLTTLFSAENRKGLEFKGSKSTKPVFIIGMPRSGTTLLEQIMSAHSEISSAGERREMITIFRQLMTRTGQLSGSAHEAALLSLIDEEGEGIAASYLETLEEEGDATAMIIDKLPQNFERLGLINILFPKAKIIHLKRDPLDVGLSIYGHQYSVDWRFFQDLGDIGFYIRKYRELMAAWKGIIDLPVHEVDYRALVEDPEEVARGVIEFCGQEWQPECLDFHKKRSTVHTASAIQVRNPIDKSAIGKWQAYEKHLGPLKQGLEGQL